MDIAIRKQYKTISPFELKDLPDLVVLTGENGTGKTQLLKYLYYGSRLNERGEIVILSEEDDWFDEMPSVEIDQEHPESEGIRYILPCEICSDGNRLTNVVYRGVQAPSVDVGSQYNLKLLYSGGEKIAQKHLFYKTHSVMANMDGMSTEELTSNFNTMLGIRKGTRTNDAQYPVLTKEDVDIIKKIEAEFPATDYQKDPFYYVAFQQPPKGEVFATNLKFLYFQYWARLQAGMQVGDAPWNAFNKMGEMLNFKFELDEPKIDEKKFDVRLRDKERKVFISPDSLSSGEKVIFSLFVAMYTTHTQGHLPSLILFDEPDAYLHPSLCSTMLRVIREVFIKEHNIKVIMTTHSPTTVAMLPETSLYCMKNGVMNKVTKQDAILSLTAGLNTISVYYENVKQVFVEADNDNLFMRHVYHHAMTAGKLIKEVNLKFVNVGDDEYGGCSTVKKVVNDLSGADNKTVYGIIDFDGKNCASDRIKILGKGSRYAIDNYLVDPLAISILYLEEINERTKIGFNGHDNLVGFGDKTQAEKQKICDNFLRKLESKIPVDERKEISLITYTTMGGESYTIPEWYTIMKGHTLVGYVKEAAPFLNKYDEKGLFKKIIDTCYGNYPDIIPIEVVETLREIQECM